MSIFLNDFEPGRVFDLWLYVEWPKYETLDPVIPPGWPGVEIPLFEDPEPWVYTASLGTIEADKCLYQGYPGKLHCHFSGLKRTMLDTAQKFVLHVDRCEHSIFTHDRVSILDPGGDQTPPPPVTRVCSDDLGPTACAAAGGTFTCGEFSCSCVCPPSP